MSNVSSVPSVSRPQAPGRVRVTTQRFLGNFWIRRVFWARMLPILIFTFATYNAFWVSYISWAKGYAFEIGSLSGKDVLIHLLVLAVTALVVGGLWWYILLKAWQGVGARFLKAIILPAIVALLFWLAIELGWITTGGPFFITLIELAFGVVVSIMFSMTIIDRYLSGTMGTTTIVQEGGGSLEDQHQPVDVQVDVHPHQQ